jgi:hypothetical protein
MRSPSPSDLGYDSLSGSSESGYDSLSGSSKSGYDSLSESSVDEEISPSIPKGSRNADYDDRQDESFDGYGSSERLLSFSLNRRRSVYTHGRARLSPSDSGSDSRSDINTDFVTASESDRSTLKLRKSSRLLTSSAPRKGRNLPTQHRSSFIESDRLPSSKAAV